MSTQIFSRAVILNVAAILIFAVCGCAQEQAKAPASVPGDFYVMIDWGAAHAEKGRGKLEMTAEGKMTVVLYMDSTSPMDPPKHIKEYVLTKGELAAIYGAIIENKFFELEDRYEDLQIMDGSSASWLVKAAGREKGIDLDNASAPQIAAVARKIKEVLDSKDKDWNLIEVKIMQLDGMEIPLEKRLTEF